MKMSEDELRRHPAVGVTRKLAEVYAHHVGGELPIGGAMGIRRALAR